MTADRTRRVAVAGALLVALAPLTACGGGDKAQPAGQSVKQLLAAAKQKFDAAPSVHLSLSTDSTPTSGNAVLGADGTLTRQPAFKGTVKVVLSGFNADVPVVAVNGKVYAKLPLTPKYAEINPSEYSAPDPADFADPSKGISGLLLALRDPQKLGDSRQGKLVLHRASGTLSGEQVAPIIPSADPNGTYKTVVGIDDQDRIVTLDVTGEFFSGGGDETYKLAFDDYGKSVKITAP